MIRKMILAYAVVFTAVMSYALPQPAVWFKADTGVTVENGKVVKWANQGSLGSEQDLAPAGDEGASAAAITLADHANMGAVVRFDGTDFLTASVASKYGITTEMTAIMVLSHDKQTSANTRPGIWCSKPETDTSDANDYMGCFYYNEYVVNMSMNTDWRAHQIKFGKTLYKTTGHVVSFVYFPNTGYGYNRGGYSDEGSIGAARVGVGSSLQNGFLRLGNHTGRAGNVVKYAGDFAEFRLYNKALTAAERFQVECELAAKYNLDINPAQVSTATNADLIPGTAFAACATEPCAFGDVPKGGKAVSEIAASGTSGQLTVSLGTAPTAEENSLVYLANNGATGLDTVWCVAAAPGARNKALHFSFEASEYASAIGLKFCSRSSSSAAWTPVAGAVLTKTASAYEVTLAAGWTSAQYALVGKAPAVWFKADTGVTVENGKVVKWANQGTLGSEQDLTSGHETSPSATAITVAQHANMGTVIRFDGTDFLQAGTLTKFGITDEATIICVVDHDKGSTSDRQSLWSTKTDSTDGNDRDYLCMVYWDMYLTNLGGGTGWRNSQVKFGRQLFTGVGHVLSVVAVPGTGYGYNRGGYADDGDVTASKNGIVGLDDGYLRIGRSPVVPGITNEGIYRGDFAEFRLYNKALTAAERFQVECELAAKYNLDINPVQVSVATDADLIPKTVFAGCATEPCAFGDAPKGGLAVATIETSGSSGPLTVSLGTAPTAEENSLVYLANNGATGLDTVWCVAAAPGARAKPLNLSFDSAVSPDEKHLVLYGNSNGRWARIPVEVTQSADKFVCTLPAGWTSEKLSLRVRRGLFIVVQ